MSKRLIKSVSYGFAIAFGLLVTAGAHAQSVTTESCASATRRAAAIEFNRRAWNIFCESASDVRQRAMDETSRLLDHMRRRGPGQADPDMDADEFGRLRASLRDGSLSTASDAERSRALTRVNATLDRFARLRGYSGTPHPIFDFVVTPARHSGADIQEVRSQYVVGRSASVASIARGPHAPAGEVRYTVNCTYRYEIDQDALIRPGFANIMGLEGRRFESNAHATLEREFVNAEIERVCGESQEASIPEPVAPRATTARPD